MVRAKCDRHYRVNSKLIVKFFMNLNLNESHKADCYSPPNLELSLFSQN